MCGQSLQKWNGMEWNGMGWNGMERNGMERNGMYVSERVDLGFEVWAQRWPLGAAHTHKQRERERERGGEEEEEEEEEEEKEKERNEQVSNIFPFLCVEIGNVER